MMDEARPGFETETARAQSVAEQGSVYFIGNATTLIRCGPFTILTDPTFIHMHERVSIGYGMHSTRLTDPATNISQLPALDLVLLSHFHGDHFDQVAERELDKSLPIVTTPPCGQGTPETRISQHSPSRDMVLVADIKTPNRSQDHRNARTSWAAC